MDIEDTLTQFVAQELLRGRVTVEPEDNLLGEGMVDSLGMLRLVAFIDERFGLKVPPGEVTIENFRSIEVLTDYLKRALAGNEDVRRTG